MLTTIMINIVNTSKACKCCTATSTETVTCDQANGHSSAASYDAHCSVADSAGSNQGPFFQYLEEISNTKLATAGQDYMRVKFLFIDIVLFQTIHTYLCIE